jgi:hypothetical protein
VFDMLGIAPDQPPTKETFAGLPMPDRSGMTSGR